jgi:hypothetical protein
MMSFFDTHNAECIRLAHTILSYPHEYCLKVENQQRLNRLLPLSEGTHRLVEMLRATQSALASHLPLPFDSVWSQRDPLPLHIAPTTIYSGSALACADVAALTRSLDRCLLEDVLETMPSVAFGVVASEGIRLAVASAWLSQHLALIALGLARAELKGADQLVVAPSSPEAIQHFRRLWFATAFEEQSLRKAQVSLDVYAFLAGDAKGLTGDVEKAFYEALALIPQHWRLPVVEGPVAMLLEDHLRPLIWLAGAAINAEHFRGRRPIVRSDLPSERFRQVFDAVIRDQSSRRLLDRAFDVRNGGLVLGPRKLAPGLLLIAERMAAQLLGPTWHDKDLSNVQKKYILERLRRIPHVQIVDVEIAKHDTIDETHVDVDLFVRDMRQGILFAVQLKHLEYSDKGGLRYWLSRFLRADKGLAYGVAQLDAFRLLAKSDIKVRTKLLASGIDADELDRVVPVVLHNIGVMDCLAFQAGILVYDQHTFVNVLDGRPAVGVGVADGQAVHVALKGAAIPCRLDDPDTVISAYACDPHFAAIAHFDAAANITRHLSLLGATVTAEGLGV